MKLIELKVCNLYQGVWLRWPTWQSLLEVVKDEGSRGRHWSRHSWEWQTSPGTEDTIARSSLSWSPPTWNYGSLEINNKMHNQDKPWYADSSGNHATELICLIYRILPCCTRINKSWIILVRRAYNAFWVSTKEIWSGFDFTIINTNNWLIRLHCIITFTFTNTPSSAKLRELWATLKNWFSIK